MARHRRISSTLNPWKIIPCLAACICAPTFGRAESATAPSGIKTQLTLHSRFDSQCRSIRTEIRILAPPANGTVTSEPKNYAIPAQNRLGEKQPQQCVGKIVEGVAVFYQSQPGFAGSDSVRYRRFNPNDANDRYNMEISYAITVLR